MEDYIVQEDISIIDAMRHIDKNARGLVFVCNKKKLVGVVTDGDIRRYILKNGDLNCSIGEITNRKPYFKYEDEKFSYRYFMKKHGINALPLLNEKDELVRIEFLYRRINSDKESLNVPVVIMAGGKGTRLMPYTQIVPKPLIPVGDKTILEHIMDRFEEYDCNHFDLIVNYKKNFIKAFFLDCDNDRDVSFYDEEKFLGTGGGLKLLEGKYNSTFFMSNCDILIEEDYGKILEHHRSHHNIITMVCAMKNIVIPYGTVQMSEDGKILELAEKPVYPLMTNTGLYVIEPSFLEKIPDDTFIHITDVIQKCIDDGENVGVYPISEELWMDMGQMEELEKMRERIGEEEK